MACAHYPKAGLEEEICLRGERAGADVRGISMRKASTSTSMSASLRFGSFVSALSRSREEESARLLREETISLRESSRSVDGSDKGKKRDQRDVSASRPWIIFNKGGREGRRKGRTLLWISRCCLKAFGKEGIQSSSEGEDDI